MSKLPDADPIPDRPPLRLKEGPLCLVSPMDLAEACFSIPAVRALKRMLPSESIGVLCPDSLLPLWQSISELDEVITYPDNLPARKIVLQFNSAKLSYGVAILWEPSEATKAVARVGVKQRLGYPAKGLEKSLTDHVECVIAPGPIEHRVRYYLAMVDALGGDAFVRANFETGVLPVRPEVWRIAIARESEYGLAYQWPNERFDQVKQTMETQHGQIDWVRVTGTDVNLSDKLGACSALLACDGHVAHWAAQIGLPAVVIFGPSEPEWKRPLGKQSRVVREHVACSPCYLAKCPLDHRCQDDISVEQVVSELNLALQDTTS